MNAKHDLTVFRDQPIVHGMTRESLGEGGRLVWDFLTLFAERRYAEANAFLAPGCEMLFPGRMVFTDCTELPRRASTIYQWVKKVFERVDEFQSVDGIVVYNYGTLRGQWLDGEPFEGIRYIDRFLLRGGRIVDQKVWNDLAVVAAARKRG
jgi:ketosteroid isomerase-like protein